MIRRLYRLFAPRAHTIIIFSALVFTLGAKFYQSYRYGMVREYHTWILADVTFLLGMELALTLASLRWPRAWVMRFCNVLASAITTWAVINAAWLVRNGTQILPATLQPLIRDPLNNFPIVGVNLYKHPITALLLLVPSFVMLAMVIKVIARPVQPQYNRRVFRTRLGATLVLLALAFPANASLVKQRPSQPATSGLHFSSHCKAISSLFRTDASTLQREDFVNATRTIPAHSQVYATRSVPTRAPNLLMVVLEGIQYRYTSLGAEASSLTPYLQQIGEQGVNFASTRSALTHTTKALFALMTGRYPCASQDVVEAIPVEGGYASLASILERQLGFRTAFMQSAKGNFESRPGLVRNLGFQEFVAREDIGDPNAHLGYLAADEFAMLPLISAWLDRDTQPFFLTVLCSASHDPYMVPDWFGTPAKEPTDRYRQIVRYIDEYIRALDLELARRGLRENTILCVVGDHGEGFGEHGKLGHDRIGFEEVLRIPWVIRSPYTVVPGTQIDAPVSSIDVAPTLLSLMGFEPGSVGCDGLDALGMLPEDRKVFFSGWAPEGAAGYVVGNKKVIHNPSVDELIAYDLIRDPGETNSLDVPDGQDVIEAMIHWRRASIIKPHRVERGRMLLYDMWLCRWAGRSPITKLQAL
jgi:glucan phosphoethanolaminetransferase (alkaline phosphatase superfamily)